jgi:hypothetical protein
VGVKEVIDKERGKVYFHRDADDLLKFLQSKLDKCAIDQELQINDFIFCVAHFDFCFVVDKKNLKISKR